MNYEDGDVSMASMVDEHCDMSLDHEAIDVVWQSTQSTTLQSILDESKLRKPTAISSTANPNAPAPFVLPGSKSLFRDTSATRPLSSVGDKKPSALSLQRQFQPILSRTGSVPSPFAPQVSTSGDAQPSPLDTMADMRKIRPSQRRSSTRYHTGQSSESTEVTQQDLESLKYMINTVSRIWGQERSSTTVRASNSAKSMFEVPTRSQGSSGSQPRRSEPVKTIKLGRPLESSQSQSRQTTGEIKGLMLPPAFPVAARAFEPKPPPPMPVQPPANSDHQRLPEESLCDVSMTAEEAETETSFDLSEPPSPSPTIRANSKACQEQSKAPVTIREKRSSQGSARLPSTNLLAQLRGGTQRSLSQNPVPTANIAQRTLGMRRTASGNNVLPSNVTKRGAETKLQPSRTQSQVSKSQEQLGANSKGFKVPWATESPTLAPNSLPASQNSTLSVSSPVSESGSDSASTVSGRRPASMAIQSALPENPDSSYSFDDIDTEELHRVLSQCGA